MKLRLISVWFQPLSSHSDWWLQSNKRPGCENNLRARQKNHQRWIMAEFIGPWDHCAQLVCILTSFKNTLVLMNFTRQNCHLPLFSELFTLNDQFKSAKATDTQGNRTKTTRFTQVWNHFQITTVYSSTELWLQAWKWTFLVVFVQYANWDVWSPVRDWGCTCPKSPPIPPPQQVEDPDWSGSPQSSWPIRGNQLGGLKACSACHCSSSCAACWVAVGVSV